MSQSHEVDRSSSATNEIHTVGATGAAAARRESPFSTSSPTKADQAMAESKIPNLYEYWKALMVDDTNLTNLYAVGWLPRGLVCSSTTLEFPSIDHTNIVCFELHQMCDLSLPPSKFLVAILNYLGYERIHLHLNAISALSFFSMYCKCWLGIPPDTSLFWYFYSPAHCENKLFYGLGLTLRRNRWDEHPKATFKGCWKGSSQGWFHVDMAVVPQWSNKHMLLALIDDKQKAPKMMPRLEALAKHMAAIHEAGLEAHHCTEEFILWWICPLGQREKLAFECPRFADPTCNHSSCKNSTLSLFLQFSLLLYPNIVLAPNRPI
jgi:hypothetical protein